MAITDQDILEAVRERGGATYMPGLHTSLQVRFPFATRDQRQAAIDSALHRRVVVVTAMGHVRRTPEPEFL